MALHYCKKCGRVVNNSDNVKDFKCDYCNSITYKVPEKYWLDGLDFLITKDSEKLLREELVKTSPEFDPNLFEHRDEDLNNRWRENEAKIAHGKAILEGKDKGNKFNVECPYCHSTNTQKISAISKIWSLNWLGMYGLGKVSKQWHCNNCDSDF